MRILLAGILGAIAVICADVAVAQPGGSERPWCIRDGTFGRGSWDCSYHNQQQCLASASGAGGWCTRNPWYQPPRSKPRRERRY
jgi:hypothetical protein